ncbi:hypothetical protein ACFXDE_04600 [Kitasatospora sp. NPDC059408]|uniref:hypothetical protein n=1 Tax=Kitasatospora sp. NPDC059408 TaxID=3346823 RepID=UPI0036BD886F
MTARRLRAHAAGAAMVLPALPCPAAAHAAGGQGPDGLRDVVLVGNSQSGTVFYASYWPLAAWGPLLGILTVHYYRRRKAAESVGMREDGAPSPAVTVSH